MAAGLSASMGDGPDLMVGRFQRCFQPRTVRCCSLSLIIHFLACFVFLTFPSRTALEERADEIFIRAQPSSP